MKFLNRPLTGVLAFCLLAGVVSGLLTATTFMPLYSIQYNWRNWHPGIQEMTVLGQVVDSPESRVLYVNELTELSDQGIPLSRLWRFDADKTVEPLYALVAHGIWRKPQQRDEISLNLEGGVITVPVAGVWHPFHPQLGDNWVVLVGQAELPVTTVAPESIAPVEKVGLLPANFQGGNLVSWMLFNTFGFLLYGAIGFLSKKGKCAGLGWVVKLWVGGGVAVLVGIATAGLTFVLKWPLPVLGLLPMTLGLLGASYLLALILLTGLSMVLAKIN